VKHNDVIIIGAGPSGLMMAAQLLRFGIQPIILDVKDGPVKQSRALVVHARSLEIYDQMGLTEEALIKGKKLEYIALNDGEKEVQRIPFGNIGKDLSKFPFVEILEQSSNERLLVDNLTKACCPISWQTQYLNHKTEGEQIILKAKHLDKELTFSCNWLIAADGASSMVRKNLGIDFIGGTYKQQFYLADLDLKTKFNDDAVRLFFANDDFAACFPMKESNSFRFIGMIPDNLRNKHDLIFSDVKSYLNKAIDYPLQLNKCNWFSTYQLHHRMANQFRKSNIFLIGDAAHVHSPVGGQGMNTGLQDAYNLAWKLAGVIQNKFDEGILKSYEQERIPVAKYLLRTTDRVFKFATSRNFILKRLRKLIFNYLIRSIWKNEKLSLKLFKLISQTGIAYTNSNINLNLSQSEKIKAGDRLPFIKFYDEKKEEETNLHEWCKGNRFTLLLVGYFDKENLFYFARWINLNYDIQLYYLPPTEKNKHLFKDLDVIEGEKKMILVRPDLHISFLSDRIDREVLDNYLENVMLMKRKEKVK
jgi:2-polyprenyl-6-methoxyphenol hydroxylase-like FAD-dependent oxidoreductase